MADLDLSIPVENVTDLDTEISNIRGDKDYGKESQTIGGNKRSALLTARLTKCYERKFPEPEGRQGEPNSGERGISDMARKEFGSESTKEKIDSIGAEARQKVIDGVHEQVYLEAEGELRGHWGQEYDGNLSLVHNIVDNVVNKADRELIIEHFGNDTEFLDALALIGRKIDPVFWKGEGKKYKREVKK